MMQKVAIAVVIVALLVIAFCCVRESFSGESNRIFGVVAQPASAKKKNPFIVG